MTRTGTGAHLAGVGGVGGVGTREGGIGEIYGELCPSHAGSGDHFVSCLVAAQLSVDFDLSMSCLRSAGSLDLPSPQLPALFRPVLPTASVCNTASPPSTAQRAVTVRERFRRLVHPFVIRTISHPYVPLFVTFVTEL